VFVVSLISELGLVLTYSMLVRITHFRLFFIFVVYFKFSFLNLVLSISCYIFCFCVCVYVCFYDYPNYIFIVSIILSIVYAIKQRLGDSSHGTHNI